MLKRMIFTAVVLAVAAVPLALAGSNGPVEKLGEGVGKTATGWAEAPREMVEESERSNPAVGVTKGTVVGAGKAVKKTVEGAAETATFLIPDSKK